MEIPSIDQNICGAWTEQQIDLYNKLPFYLLEGQTQYRKYWETWSKVLNGRVSWKPNMGDTMRTVVAEPTPVMRQTAFPNLLREIPKTDIISYLERKLDSKPRWQDFVSPNFYFLPEFQDFLKHIKKTQENLDRQMMIFEDVFYRGQAFYKAPYVYVVGVGLVAAPTADGNDTFDATGSKTAAWLQNEVFAPLSGVAPGNLSFQELFKVLNAFEQEVGGTPYEGNGMPQADSNPLREKFCFVTSGETWNNFVDDPWLKENRPLNMNIVTETFKGDLWGRITCKLERYPMRFTLDGSFLGTLPDPETTELNPDREDYGRTLPNPSYARPSISQVEVGFLIGGPNYDIIDPAPPPAEFTRDIDIGDVSKMNWNGKSYLNRNFLTRCTNAANEEVTDSNSFGRYIRLQGTKWVGSRATNAFNVLPVFFKRRIGVNTVT